MSAQHIKQLEKLNAILREEEIRVQQEVLEILTEWRSRPPDTTHYNDIEIEVCFDYYAKDEDNPFHIYNMVLLVKEDSSGFSQDLFETDWTDVTGLPQLNAPTCYTLHDLLDHGAYPMMNWQEVVNQLDHFWVETKVTYQHKISIHEK